MSDRAFLFLFSVLMIIVGLGVAVWLGVTGQAGSVDGLFLLLTSLLVALVFALYVFFLTKRAMEGLQAANPHPKAEAASQQKPALVRGEKTAES